MEVMDIQDRAINPDSLSLPQRRRATERCFREFR
jgi:hypothetical protein